jgi:hypothetical protein
MGRDFAKCGEPEYMFPGATEKCRYDRGIHKALFPILLEKQIACARIAR